MPDLREAAEALLKVATSSWLEEPDDPSRLRDAIDALRAALAAVRLAMAEEG